MIVPERLDWESESAFETRVHNYAAACVKQAGHSFGSGGYCVACRCFRADLMRTPEQPCTCTRYPRAT